MRSKIALILICLACLAVAKSSSPPSPFVFAQEGEQVTFRLDRVRVVDLTGCLGDGDCYNNDDEPYFPMIAFRSRVLTPNSTEVWIANEFFKFAELDEDSGENEAAIPPTGEDERNAGKAVFDNVHFSTIDSMAEGDYPEVLGTVILALESDGSEGAVRDSINGQIPNLVDQLRKTIEDGELVDILLGHLDADSSNEDDDNDDEQGNDKCTDFEKVLGDLPSDNFSVLEQIYNWLDLDLDGYIFPLEILDALIITPFADYFVDDMVDIHIIAYVTILESEADLRIECEIDGTTLTISSWPVEDKETSPVPGADIYSLDDNPLVFSGDGGEWHVQASMTTTAEESKPSPSDFTYESKHPLLTSRVHLPLLLDAIVTNPSSPGETPHTELWVSQYNVQFLTPWNEGIVASDHWPNTVERAVAVGEALACYDIIALNETINDARRGQIIGTMQAKAPFCGRPKYLPGESFFTFVDGPDLDTTHIITDTKSAIETVIDNPGKSVVGNEVTIVSRFPIVESNSHTYECSYGEDGLAAKGVLHARVRVGEPDSFDYIDVFATHLQAGYDFIRHCQLLELADFIYEHAEPDNAVLLLGDFNIDGSPSKQADEESQYQDLVRILNSVASAHFLWDAGYHLTTGTNHSENPDKHRMERIDYLFMSQSGLKVDPDDVHIIDFGGLTGDKPTLSDHAAVAAIVQLEQEAPAGEDAAPDLVVETISVTPEVVQVGIKNVGTGSLLPGNDLWVDLYLCPKSPPTVVNQVWADLGDAGLVWGVDTSGLTLPPDGELILNINDVFYDATESRYPELIPAGCEVFVQVDSANLDTDYGGVLETHELSGAAYNNIASITLPAPVSTAAWESIAPGRSPLHSEDEVEVDLPRE